MNVHDISFNEKVPLVFAGCGSNNIGNVQVAWKGGELNIPRAIDVSKNDLDAYITEMHLENLWQQRLLWKPHYHTSLTQSIINTWI
jgi:hypothetical protein